MDYPTETTYKRVYNVTICGRLFVLEDHCVRKEIKSCKDAVDRFSKFIKDLAFENISSITIEKIYFALLKGEGDFYMIDKTKTEGDKFFDEL